MGGGGGGGDLLQRLPKAGDLPIWGEFSKISRSPAWVWFSPAQVVCTPAEDAL